jgi:hypothetical protein
MAVLCHQHQPYRMKTNQDLVDSGPLSVPYSASDTLDRTDQRPELNSAGNNRVFRVGNSPSGTVASAIATRGAFPLRTLIVCFTIWLIATQAMIFDQVKFDQRVHLLEQQARSLGVPQVLVPNEPASNLPTGAKVQRL